MGGFCSSFVGVKALRVEFYQAPLPLSESSAPVEVVTEGAEAHGFTLNLCATCVYIRSSAQKQPTFMSFSLCVRTKSSARLWCGIS